MTGELIFEHTVALPWIIAAMILAVGVALFTTWRYLPRNRIALGLLLLRLLFLGLFLWCLLMPILKRAVTETLKPRFLVALDTSASMTMAPAPDRSNRWAVAQSVLRLPWTQALGAQCAVDIYPFAGELDAKRSLAESLALAPSGDNTRLRASLKKLTDRYKGQNICGLLVLSDGIDTREVNDDWASGKWPCPIYTVRLEEPGIWKVEPDVRVDSVATPRRVVIGWDTELKATVSGQGTGGQAIDVQLYDGNRLLQEAPVTIAADGGSRELTFRLSHPETGNFTYKIIIPPLARETRTNDNTFAVSVQVIDTKNRLLYLEGIPRYESKFLVRALKRAKEITPICFIRGPGGRFLSYGTRSKSAPELNASILSKFKIIILGDLDADELGKERAQALVKFVETGGSLVLLGGAKAWGKHGFAATPLATIMPIKQTGTLALQEGRFNVGLTREGRSHPAFLADDKQTPWTEIPSVLSVFQGGAATPGAMTLIATDPDSQPVIIAQHYGQGKVIAILTDSLWRWQLNPGQGNPYYQFWTRLLLWLSPAEGDLREYQLDLFADSERLFLGDTIDLQARLGGTETLIPQDTTVTCEIQGPDKRRLPFTMAGQEVMTTTGKKFPGYGFRFTPTAPGLYKAIALAQLNGKKIESTPYSFFIKPFTPESNPRPANVAVLKALTAASHGQFCEPAGINDVLTSIQVKTSEEERINIVSLWNILPIIICLMSLLALEWTYRKVKNMA